MAFVSHRRLLSHTALLCVLILLVAGVAQAVHFHASDRTNASHCSGCVVVKTPAAPVAISTNTIDATSGVLVSVAVQGHIHGRDVLSSYNRPPPSF